MFASHHLNHSNVSKMMRYALRKKSIQKQRSADVGLVLLHIYTATDADGVIVTAIAGALY